MDTQQIKIFIFILSVLAVNSARKDGMAPTPDQLHVLNEFSDETRDAAWENVSKFAKKSAFS